MAVECKKTKFGSEKDATFYIEKLKVKSKRDTKPVRAYHCWCGSWHLSSKRSFSELTAEIEGLTIERDNLKNKLEQIQLIINSKN